MLLNCSIGEDSRESLGGTSNQSILKEINPEYFGRTDAEAEAPTLWPPDAKNWVIGKDSDAGKDWRQEEKGTTEEETVERHHQLGGLEIEWALRVINEQGSLACCSPWDHKEWNTDGQLNWTKDRETNEVNHYFVMIFKSLLKRIEWYRVDRRTLKFSLTLRPLCEHCTNIC